MFFFQLLTATLWKLQSLMTHWVSFFQIFVLHTVNLWMAHKTHRMPAYQNRNEQVTLEMNEMKSNESLKFYSMNNKKCEQFIKHLNEVSVLWFIWKYGSSLLLRYCDLTLVPISGHFKEKSTLKSLSVSTYKLSSRLIKFKISNCLDELKGIAIRIS